ncbi:unnamed protein product, partial [Ectocarpus sp. 12 AP-2014]
VSAPTRRSQPTVPRCNTVHPALLHTLLPWDHQEQQQPCRANRLGKGAVNNIPSTTRRRPPPLPWSMRASFLPPWSKIALCVFACVCSLAYLSKAAVHPGIVAPPKPDDASSAEGQYSAEGRFSAVGQYSAEGRYSVEERHSAEDRGAARRPQQVAAAEEEGTKAAAPGVLEVGATTPGSAEEEGHGSLRSREGEAQEG